MFINSIDLSFLISDKSNDTIRQQLDFYKILKENKLQNTAVTSVKTHKLTKNAKTGRYHQNLCRNGSASKVGAPHIQGILFDVLHFFKNI